MRDLDENEIYYTGSLNKNQLEVLLDWLKKNDRGWEDYSIDGLLEINGTNSLLYSDGSWCWSGNTFKTKNAKELFYTLENVQVDCRELSEEQINNIKTIVENSGYETNNGYYRNINYKFNYYFFKLDNSKTEFYFGEEACHKTTITYDKFMELFGRKEENFKKLVEVVNEELTEEYNNSQFKQIANSLADLLEYKNKMYGNSALEPLNIFNNKCKAGQRLDDKLARIKNSNELRKNDICDLIGYLILTCKENNWTNFDEFKD